MAESRALIDPFGARAFRWRNKLTNQYARLVLLLLLLLFSFSFSLLQAEIGAIKRPLARLRHARKQCAR